MQYCGDETAALVGDMGSRTFKFGFAGEDAPKGWIASAVGRGTGEQLAPQTEPSLADPANGAQDGAADDGAPAPAAGGLLKRKRPRPAGLLIGDSELASRSADVDVVWARQDGRVNDWDAVEALWLHALEHVLSSDPREHPIMAACATYESQEDRAKLTELLFEKVEAPALYLARNAMLSAFSLGRASALVVDVGAAKTCAAPVQDGFVLSKSVRVSPLASDLVDRHLEHLLETKLLPQLAREQAAAPAAPPAPTPSPFPIRVLSELRARGDEAQLARLRPSYVAFQKAQVLADFKASVCRVWSELNFDEGKAAIYARERYELPDGTVVMIGPDRFKSGEMLIHPESDGAFGTHLAGSDSPPMSLPDTLSSALQSVHVDLRREMAQQLILVGGGSLLPGTVERLTKELLQSLPSALKPRFLTPAKPERLFSVFTGGSILATLGSFQQLWISRAEYDEHGAALLAARCPH
mmetsp:Transcript_14985/g.47679  ORF Transcript_14985/g.47679 Transcript_14985/m.47679 type:complete len:469 (-) Transcript_14985:307-1713(-)